MKSKDLTTIPTTPQVLEISKYGFTEGDQIRSGSFATVYRGRWRNQDVALKQVQFFDVSQIKKLLENEVNIMSRLNSPYIVKMHGVCYENATIVMEYLPNGALSNFLRGPNLPDWEKGRYQIGLDITYGLKYLHGEKVIHGDLKSANILVTTDLRAKITDFGRSVFELSDSDDKNKNKYKGGTERYMAPELFDQNTKPTQKSDVYSYAMVLWELGAKGVLPYKETPNAQVPKLVAAGGKEKITPDTPSNMAELIAHCWWSAEKRPTMQKAVEILESEAQSYGCKLN